MRYKRNTTFCDWCGKEFPRPPANVHPDKNFCSIVCANRAKKPRTPVEQRFWENVDKSGECWVWIGGRRNGYGIVSTYRTDGRKCQAYAHRLSWEMANGPIPGGMVVCHACDNPPCVRPDHLFVGTHSDNTQDMLSKGRMVIGERRRGEQSPRAKLTEAGVVKIREQHAGGATIGAIARNTGMSEYAIMCVVRRITWKHVA